MRLTLRALLAYLDDVLPPAKLKEIGARISESSAASATVSRIKEVVRRRRIAAPELTGSGSAPDPNIVAEYLDNTLDPTAVPALEKLCLDSDMHLAEVASSHQILTAVLGEPIEVPLTTRERMYALVGSPPPVEDSQRNEHSPLSPQKPPAPLSATAKLPLRPVTPDYLKPTSGRKLLVGLMLTAIAVGWLGWVLKDQGLIPDRNSEVAVSLPAEVEVPANVEPQESALGVPADAVDSTTPAVDATTGQSDSIEEPAADPIVPMDETALATVETNESPMPLEPIPDPEAPLVAPPEAIGLAPPPELVPPAVPMQPFPVMMYANAEGILIARDRETGQWNVLPRRSLIHEGDEIAAPDPFPAEFTIEGSALNLTLYGGGRVRLGPGAGDDLFTIEIDRGRIAIRRPAVGNDAAPVTVGLSIRGQVARIGLHEPGSACGIEVSQRAPQSRRVDPLLAFPEGGVSVISGHVSLAWNGGPAQVIGADVAWAAWPIPPAPLQAGPARAIPAWLSPEGVPLTAADKKWHQMFEKEFAIDQPVSMSIPALVSDRRENISALATYTLGLVDDIPALVKALQSDYEQTRLAAIWNLRSWLAADPNNSALLEMEVKRIFPDEDVAEVVNQLWGYSREDGRDPKISQHLIALMNHKDIALRELAYYHVSQLTGRTNAHGYRPNLADSPRNAALIGWRNQLERNGGQLVK